MHRVQIELPEVRQQPESGLKNYRIVRLTMILHGLATEAFYRAGPARATLPYTQQREALIDCGYLHFNGFARCMCALGNDAHDIVCDVEPLQKTWAREHAADIHMVLWQTEVALRQIEALRPDVLYFQDVVAFPDSLRRQLKQRFPFLKLIVVYKASSSDPTSLADADLILLGTPKLVRDFAEYGLRGELIYHAFDDTLLKRLAPLPTPAANYDITFLGSAGTGFGWSHRGRYWTLYELARQTPLEMWIFDKREKRRDPTHSLGRRIRTQLRNPIKHFLRACPPSILAGIASNPRVSTKLRWVAEEVRAERQWTPPRTGPLPTADLTAFPVIPLTTFFPERTHPPLFGPDMYQVLRASRLTFHQHGDQVGNSVGAVRMFEATGAGAGLVTDTAPNLPDLFEPDREVVTYQSTTECVEKVRYLFAHEDKCRQITAAGHRRTLRDHTVEVRCQQIHELISRAL